MEDAIKNSYIKHKFCSRDRGWSDYNIKYLPFALKQDNNKIEQNKDNAEVWNMMFHIKRRIRWSIL